MKSNNRTLFITYEYKGTISGGIARVINGIVPILRKKLQVDVFHIKCKKPYMKLAADHYKMVNDKESCKNYRTLYRALTKVLNSYSYDIVHILHIGGETAKMVRVIKEKFPQIRIIFSCHSLAVQDHKIRKANPKNIALEQEIVENCDAIHLLNNTSQNLLRENYPNIIWNKALFIVPNGINEEEYNPMLIKNKHKQGNPNLQNQITITCISRWSYGKGLEYFLKAIPLILQQTKDVKFIIAGRKNMSWEHNYSEYVRKIDDMVKQLKSHVQIMGWLNDEERNKLYEESDICIMPSELEYFPYSLLEPMITKTPVVSSNIDCAIEAFSENSECLFFENKDHLDLADKVLQLIYDRELRNTLSRNAYQKVSMEFEWQNITNKYYQMYEELTQNCEIPLTTYYK